jgi:hypothetical protein
MYGCITKNKLKLKIKIKMKAEHLKELGKVALVSLVVVIAYDKVIKPMILQKFISSY